MGQLISDFIFLNRYQSVEYIKFISIKNYRFIVIYLTSIAISTFFVSGKKQFYVRIIYNMVSMTVKKLVTCKFLTNYLFWLDQNL